MSLLYAYFVNYGNIFHLELLEPEASKYIFILRSLPFGSELFGNELKAELLMAEGRSLRYICILYSLLVYLFTEGKHAKHTQNLP